jgi:hypothetical protein
MSSLQVVCSTGCARSYVEKQAIKKREEKAKAERKILREKREALKSKGDHLKEAQREFNAFIRERDQDQPCISCGRHHQGQYHAGHYRSVGSAPELRFEEDNCHKQCSVCNNHLSGNLINYRINLIKKIGLERVEWLEGPHDPKNYIIEEVKDIKKKYRKETRELKKLCAENAG